MQANIVASQKLVRKSFALCESCFWSATMLYDCDVSCPSCPGSSVSLIPLAKDEEYRLKISPSAGLELSFLRQGKFSR